MALKFRRGTTAQQSGSLAYGEPYVNTTLGTLLVGGASGDIQLTSTGPSSTFAGASVSASSFVSASSLKITGNAAIDGNLTLGGAITIGDASSDTVNVVASLSSSLIPQTTNAFDLGSADKFWRDLYISTGSIKFVNGSGSIVNTITSQNLVTTDSLTSGSINLTNSLPAGTTSGSSQINVMQTTNIARLATTGSNTFTNSQYISGALEIYKLNGPDIRFANGTTGIQYHIQNGDGGHFQIHNGTTEQLLFRFTSASLAEGYQNAVFYNGVYASGSIQAPSFTGSIAANNGVISGSSQLTNTFAGLSSPNVFTANQTITGSLYITQDLVVQGSSSIQNISSSTLNIGTNLVTVATNNPSVRFGGIAVVDSGSAGGSGSFLYDSIQDEFVFVHRGNGTDTTSSVFLLGPETYNNLGNETYLTQNRVLKGTTNEHVANSNITDNGTLITLGSNTVVTGTLVASATALVSASAQIDHNSTTNYVANKHIDHTSVLISAGNGLSGGGDISSTRTLSLDTTSATFTTGVKSKLDADGVISSSAQLTSTFDSRYLNTGGDGVVSGSSQIAFSGVTGTVSNSQLANSSISGVSLGGNLATLTIGTGLSGTSYNGSSLVTIANTGVTSNVAGTGITVSGATGAVTITNAGVTSIVAGTGVSRDVATGAVTISIGQSVATNATPTFGNLTINGTITATGDITAFFTSDIRHKNNVTLIDNALDKVNALNGVTWEWNDDVDEVTKQTPTTGLIAQDVLDVLPEVVKTRENGFLALDYSKMIGLLVEAIKEQDIVIQKLKSDMVGLNTTITVFEDRMKEKGLL
jgi:trimeric autotransporter adhesin